MPIYAYKTAESAPKGCPYCRDGFEQMQSMSDRPLNRCPRCGGKVKKIPTLVAGGVPKLSNGNLRDHGFQKLEKRSDGSYERTV